MKITRKAGIGDLQHVRTGLLSVGILPPCQKEQFLGACQAARKLGMMLRGQVVCTLEEVEDIHKLILSNQDHQILTQQALSPTTYDTLEIVIELQPEEIVTIDEVMNSIVKIWRQFGGRFAGGNHGRLTAEILTEKYLS
ncbi:MAG: hypothetical protein DDT31_00699 [Syntrophomonadaceae bacterium]|nr:hypothetical protein [Bacillota bacterium]